MIVRDLLTRFGYVSDDSKLKQIDSAVSKVKKTLAGVAAFMGARGIWNNVIVATAKLGDDLDTNAGILKVSLGTYQEMSYAAEQLDSDIGTLSRAMFINSKMATEAQQGSKMALDAFKMMGIGSNELTNEMTSMDGAFMLTMDRLAGMTDSYKRTNAAVQLFGNKLAMKLMPVIDAGPGEFKKWVEQFRSMGWAMDENAAKAADNFNKRMVEMRMSLLAIRNQIGNFLIPVITTVVESVRDWWQANHEIIQQKLDDYLFNSAMFLIGVANAVLNVRDAMGGWKNVLIGIVAVKLTAWALSAAVAIAKLAAAIKSAKAAKLLKELKDGVPINDIPQPGQPKGTPPPIPKGGSKPPPIPKGGSKPPPIPKGAKPGGGAIGTAGVWGALLALFYAAATKDAENRAKENQEANKAWDAAIKEGRATRTDRLKADLDSMGNPILGIPRSPMAFPSSGPASIGGGGMKAGAPIIVQPKVDNISVNVGGSNASPEKIGETTYNAVRKALNDTYRQAGMNFAVSEM